ncbi:MAG: late competence development ComFB family protein [Clostridiales bacterium]|nr:late competence development ComFB family protein [Clostridiales bacterium]
MTKKSNKTSHVLNLITNRTGLTADDIEDNASRLRPAGPPDKPAVAAVPKRAFGDVSEQIRANLERIEAFESDARAEALKSKNRERAKMVEERLSGYADHTVVSMKHDTARNSQVEAFDPEDFGPPDATEAPDETEAPSVDAQPQARPDGPAQSEAHADAPSPVPAEPQHMSADSGKSMDGFVMTNILEEVLRLEATTIMNSYDMCCCDRCTNDVIAITLNNMPPKYVVSRKGSLFAKIASYGMQYRTDLYSKLAEACAIVSKSPNHL